MKKRKIFSPYYDFKSFEYKNPYLTSPVEELPVRTKKFGTADGRNSKNSQERKSLEIDRSTSCVNLEVKKASESGGNGEQFQESFEDISEYKQLNHSTKSCQTTSLLKNSAKPKRVPSQSIFSLNQQMMNKKTRESQNTLRYLLKLSNNTFYATLKHEIDMLKKREDSLQDELSLHSQSILKILKCQKDGDETLTKIITQIQKIEEEFQAKGSTLQHLLDQVQELKFMLNSSLESTEHVDAMMYSQIDKNKAEVCKDFPPQPPPRSAPSMIPRRAKIKKQVRVSSEPAIIYRPDSDDRIGDGKDSASDLLTNVSEGCSDLLSDLNICVSKNVSWDSSKMKVDQKTVGTNYSANDFCASGTTCSMKSFSKRRHWYEIFCCR